ncbi:sensor domain-containing diguanylate cyclase [Thiorhodovibrio frisius]|uniref:diguanylate cyclase n=1 Tax=Thiorhodovibrio frisius TaxID=631362 RepID=H8Z399_9GAMM|nr:GGDEF domain-containing protein [Thiorhodovibrio frisius]EIC21807.1 diguanylate cyclase (GGDEF) domain-containing protein [Thiorhodovibrio frisius]WPL21777.1 putative diguanylate cyclase YdaM [Thiorhodovibrio frisius]
MSSATETVDSRSAAVDIDQAARARRDQGESDSKRRISARTRNAWLICVVMIATIAAAGTTQLVASHRLAIATATERATAKGFLIAEWIAKSFDLTEYVLRDTVKRFDADELVYPSDNAGLHERKTALIIDKAASVPNLLFLGMLNANCVITHTSIGGNIGLDAQERGREYCTLAQSEPVDAFKISNMFTSVTNAMNVTASMPLLSATGQLEGFALAGLDLGFFQQWLDLVELEPHNVIAIFDLNSRLLTRKPLIASQIGQRVAEEKLNTLARSGSEALVTHRLVSPVDGIDRIWALRKIRGLPFIAVVGEETRTALGAWRQQLFLYLIGGAILCLSIVFGTREYIRNVRDAATMRELAITDTLTGLANRRHFMEAAEIALARRERTATPMTLILADLDHFKWINDNRGHATGDRVLREVASVLKDLSRKGDLAARWGGEEFVILLPGAGQGGARAFAERLRREIAALESAPGRPVTLSQGLTAWQPQDTLDDMLKRADAALYRAKREGRDRVDIE